MRRSAPKLYWDSKLTDEMSRSVAADTTSLGGVIGKWVRDAEVLKVEGHKCILCENRMQQHTLYVMNNRPFPYKSAGNRSLPLKRARPGTIESVAMIRLDTDGLQKGGEMLVQQAKEQSKGTRGNTLRSTPPYWTARSTVLSKEAAQGSRPDKKQKKYSIEIEHSILTDEPERKKEKRSIRPLTRTAPCAIPT